jgi:F-type H+-transporting ATPase subunit b
MQFFNEQFWLAVSFLIFLYLVYKPIKNIILKSLDDKIVLIKNQVLEAQKLNNDMTSLYEDVVNQLAQLDHLKETMLKAGQETANEIIEKRTKEIDYFLENKKQEVIHLINNQKLLACQDIQSEFSNKIVEVISIYLKDQGDTLSDSDITKKLMDHEHTGKGLN